LNCSGMDIQSGQTTTKKVTTLSDKNKNNIITDISKKLGGIKRREATFSDTKSGTNR